MIRNAKSWDFTVSAQMFIGSQCGANVLQNNQDLPLTIFCSGAQNFMEAISVQLQLRQGHAGISAAACAEIPSNHRRMSRCR